MNASTATPTPDLGNLTGYYNRRFTGQYCCRHDGRHSEQLRVLLACVPATNGKILDYGCGSAGCTSLLKEFFPQAEIHGIDISDEAIKTARTRFPDCHFSPFDGARAPYADAEFDLIFSSHVLEHVLSLDKTARDLARMLRKGGFLCLTLPCANEGSLEGNLTRLMSGGIIQSATGEDKWCWEDPSHLRRLTSRDLATRFSREGLALRKSFFGNQFWGGVESVCACGPGLIWNWLKVARARGLWGKAKLLVAKSLLLLLSPVYLANMNLREKARGFRGMKKALCHAAIPLRWAYLPLAKKLKALADEEWETHRANANGASQFLVFQKK